MKVCLGKLGHRTFAVQAATAGEGLRLDGQRPATRLGPIRLGRGLWRRPRVLTMHLQSVETPEKRRGCRFIVLTAQMPLEACTHTHNRTQQKKVIIRTVPRTLAFGHIRSDRGLKISQDVDAIVKAGAAHKNSRRSNREAGWCRATS